MSLFDPCTPRILHEHNSEKEAPDGLQQARMPVFGARPTAGHQEQRPVLAPGYGQALAPASGHWESVCRARVTSHPMPVIVGKCRTFRVHPARGPCGNVTSRSRQFQVCYSASGLRRHTVTVTDKPGLRPAPQAADIITVPARGAAAGIN